MGLPPAVATRPLSKLLCNFLFWLICYKLVDFQVDGQLTLESNVADVGGLKIAYDVNGDSTYT